MTYLTIFKDIIFDVLGFMFDFNISSPLFVTFMVFVVGSVVLFTFYKLFKS